MSGRSAFEPVAELFDLLGVATHRHCTTARQRETKPLKRNRARLISHPERSIPLLAALRPRPNGTAQRSRRHAAASRGPAGSALPPVSRPPHNHNPQAAARCCHPGVLDNPPSRNHPLLRASAPSVATYAARRPSCCRHISAYSPLDTPAHNPSPQLRASALPLADARTCICCCVGSVHGDASVTALVLAPGDGAGSSASCFRRRGDLFSRPVLGSSSASAIATALARESPAQLAQGKMVKKGSLRRLHLVCIHLPAVAVDAAVLAQLRLHRVAVPVVLDRVVGPPAASSSGSRHARRQHSRGWLLRAAATHGSCFEISAQRLPQIRCARMSFSSSVSDHGPLRTSGERWFCHLRSTRRSARLCAAARRDALTARGTACPRGRAGSRRSPTSCAARAAPPSSARARPPAR